MKKIGKVLLIVLGVLSLVLNVFLITNNQRKNSYSGGSYYSYNSYDAVSEEAYDYDYAPMAVASSGTQLTESAKKTEMLIKHANTTIVAKDTGALEKEIREKINALGGGVDSSNSYQSGDYTYYTLEARIPSVKYDEFAEYLKENKVTSFSENIYDIYNEYTDNELRIEMYNSKLERLYQLMENAEDMSDLITIENSISETIYSIERLKSQQNEYLDEVNYSTFYININPEYKEVVEERSFLSILHSAFTNSVNSFLNFLEGALRFLFYILPYSLLLLLGYWIVRKVVLHK